MRFMHALFCFGIAVVASGGTARPASAQSNVYLGTIGTTGIPGVTDGQFSGPQHLAVDRGNGRVLVADSANHRVQVFSAADFVYVATLGTTGLPGSDNASFAVPSAVAVDTAHNRVLVADTNNLRVQVFDATSFDYLTTLGGADMTAGDGTDFNFPMGIGIDPVHGRIMVADTLNNRVQIFDSDTLAYIATLGDPAGFPGFDEAHLSGPQGVAFDTLHDRILVADTANDRVQIFDGSNFVLLATMGGQLLDPLSDNEHLSETFDVAYDLGRDQILVVDADNERIQAFDAGTFIYEGTIGTTAVIGRDEAHFNLPVGVAVDGPGGPILVTDLLNERVQIFADALPSALDAAVLPGDRSVQRTGDSSVATVLATMVNGGGAALSNCGVGLTDFQANALSDPVPLTLDFQATDPGTNTVTGTLDTPVSIEAGAARSFLLAFEAPTAHSFTGRALSFTCDGTTAAPIVYGVNTVDLQFSPTPVPDVIAQANTASGNGILTVPLSQGQRAAFAVATMNAGAASALTAALDVGDAVALPLEAALCQTNPATGRCLAAPATTVPIKLGAEQAATFSVFVSATGAIPFDPTGARLFVRFFDGDGVSHGSTSVAVTTD
jgi:DNA-binding beta-propeller fold protein YncE